jgi:lipopolysaccharide export system protein LptC
VASDNRYSRFVAWAKVLLPLAAVALFSSVFLLARGSATSEDIPYAEIEAIARDTRLDAPAFAGVAEDGSAVTLRADSIRPAADRPEDFVIAGLRAVIDAAAAGRIEITAAEGRFDLRRRQITLTGLARITTSTGYAMETRGLTADLHAGTVETAGPLEVRAPYGDITAGALSAGPAPGGGAQRLVFKEGVRLLYRPGTGDPAP